MNSKAVGFGVIAILIGVLAGYLVWGASSQTLDGELASVKGKLAEARKAAVQEGALATKLQELEGQLKQASERLTSEKDAREKLEALVAKKGKK